jgi:hypothetical protein
LALALEGGAVSACVCGLVGCAIAGDDNSMMATAILQSGENMGAMHLLVHAKRCTPRLPLRLTSLSGTAAGKGDFTPAGLPAWKLRFVSGMTTRTVTNFVKTANGAVSGSMASFKLWRSSNLALDVLQVSNVHCHRCHAAS